MKHILSTKHIADALSILACIGLLFALPRYHPKVNCSIVRTNTYDQCSTTFKQLYYNTGMVGDSSGQRSRDNPACEEISGVTFTSCEANQ